MDLSDPATFSRVYDEQSRGVYAAAYRILGNAAQAQDVVQDVFLKVWRRPGSFDSRRGELGSYLRLMARSRALDLWREGQAAGRAGDRLKLVVAGEETRPEDRPSLMAERADVRTHGPRRARRAPRQPARGRRTGPLGRPDRRRDRAALRRPARHRQEPDPARPHEAPRGVRRPAHRLPRARRSRLRAERTGAPSCVTPVTGACKAPATVMDLPSHTRSFNRGCERGTHCR